MLSEPLAYLNGRISPFSQTQLPVTDLGLVMGASVTEMARTFGFQPFRLSDHIERLFRSMRHVRFKIDLTEDGLSDLVHEMVEHNSKLVPAGHDLGISCFVTAGTSLTYVGLWGQETARKPTVCVHTFPLPFELWDAKYTDGQHVVIPSTRAIPTECLDPKLKSRSRMHWYLADEQARMVDPNAIALVLDQDGNVAETSTANFFIVQGRVIITPTSRNTLIGVSQCMVEELAADCGYRFERRDFQPYDVINADEAFTASTPYCMLSVTRINQQPIGLGAPGPVYRTLLQAWSEAVGCDILNQMQTGAAQRRAAFAAER